MYLKFKWNSLLIYEVQINSYEKICVPRLIINENYNKYITCKLYVTNMRTCIVHDNKVCSLK